MGVKSWAQMLLEIHKKSNRMTAGLRNKEMGSDLG